MAFHVKKTWKAVPMPTIHHVGTYAPPSQYAISVHVETAGVPVTVRKGCYVSLSGTNPRAIIQIRRAMAYCSDGAIRNYAHRGQ